MKNEISRTDVDVNKKKDDKGDNSCRYCRCCNRIFN